jgi:RNA polymerase-binding transcription factor DksA
VDAQQAKQRLQELLSELDGSVATLEHEGPVDDSAELSHYDQHPADAASSISEADREGALLDAARGQRAQVVAALARVEDGTYGRCVDCGVDLPAERLEARPEAARCISCQTAAEGAR